MMCEKKIPPQSPLAKGGKESAQSPLNNGGKEDAANHVLPEAPLNKGGDESSKNPVVPEAPLNKGGDESLKNPAVPEAPLNKGGDESSKNPAVPEAPLNKGGRGDWSKKKAVFFDRDNTLIFDPGYLKDPDQVRLLAGVAPALREIQKAGFLIVIITNQSGVGRGYFGLEDVKAVNARLEQLLSDEGITVSGFYICPHHPDAGCDCRKPLPGLLLQAAEELNLDLSASFMVGDKKSDIECGRRAGVRSYMVLTGPDSRKDSQGLPSEEIVEDIEAAANSIIHQS